MFGTFSLLLTGLAMLCMVIYFIRMRLIIYGFNVTDSWCIRGTVIADGFSIRIFINNDSDIPDFILIGKDIDNMVTKLTGGRISGNNNEWTHLLNDNTSYMLIIDSIRLVGENIRYRGKK